MNIRERFRGRLAAWARRRQGEDQPPLTLRSRRLYILPTRAGAGFAALLLLMLLAGLNYSNSLALLLTFLLAGVALVAMHDCHRNLADLAVRSARALPAFAGQHGDIEIQFENLRELPRHALTVQCIATGPGTAGTRPGTADTHAASNMTSGADIAPPAATTFSIEARAAVLVRVRYLAARRGLQRIDRIELSSTAPLGLFRSWTWLHLPLTALVYPRPLRLRPLPPPLGGVRAGIASQAVGGEEEWAWLRPFNTGDSPRRIAWKAFARGAPLLVAHYDAPAGSVRLFDFERLGGLDVEQRLSQLCEWILECDRRGEAYGLRIQSLEFPLQTGAGHRRACLEALAGFGT